MRRYSEGVTDPKSATVTLWGQVMRTLADPQDTRSTVYQIPTKIITTDRPQATAVHSLLERDGHWQQHTKVMWGPKQLHAWPCNVSAPLLTERTYHLQTSDNNRFIIFLIWCLLGVPTVERASKQLHKSFNPKTGSVTPPRGFGGFNFTRLLIYVYTARPT